MISTSNLGSAPAMDGRFSVMLAHFALGRPSSVEERSVLCRILDGRELVDVCPVDAAIVTPEERAHYFGTVRELRSRALAVKTRAELRRMLAREIGLPPQQVPLFNDLHGKPCCPHPLAEDLDFSVAHADDCSLIVLGEASGIGVDVERVIEEAPSDEHLAILFNDDEYLAWAHLPANLRCRAFTEAWTVKEAILKAQGMGIDGSPHDVNIHFDAHGQAWPVFPEPGWAFERIHFCPRYVASFVAAIPPAGVRRHLVAA